MEFLSIPDTLLSLSLFLFLSLKKIPDTDILVEKALLQNHRWLILVKIIKMFLFTILENDVDYWLAHL
jgi:hypothetical protein